MSRAIGLVSGAVVLASAFEVAAHHCPHPNCEHLGGWRPPAVRIELAVEAQRIPVEPGDVSDDSAQRLAHAGNVETRGLTLRAIGGTWAYLGTEINVSTIRSAPAVVPRDVAAREVGLPLDGNYGLGGGGSVVGGAHLVRGPWMLGVEGALGFRALSLSNDPDIVTTVLRPILEVRARAGVWLSPAISLSAQAGVGLLRTDLSAAVMIGFSAFPWDGLR